jgi:hypothetical protein
MNKIKKIFISAFILLNLLAMVRVHLPLNGPFFSLIYRPVDSYLSFFSIYQDWMMFAPNPSKMNVKLSAHIEFEDGSIETYDFPDPSQMTFLEKYSGGEKFRKIISEAIRKDSHKFMWKDVAKHALRKIGQRSFGKLPSKVTLFRHWDEVPSIHSEFRPQASTSQDFQKFAFYTYEVI